MKIHLHHAQSAVFHVCCRFWELCVESLHERDKDSVCAKEMLCPETLQGLCKKKWRLQVFVVFILKINININTLASDKSLQRHYNAVYEFLVVHFLYTLYMWKSSRQRHNFHSTLSDGFLIHVISHEWNQSSQNRTKKHDSYHLVKVMSLLKIKEITPFLHSMMQWV